MIAFPLLCALLHFARGRDILPGNAWRMAVLMAVSSPFEWQCGPLIAAGSLLWEAPRVGKYFARIPDGLAVCNPEQALQPFVSPSPWDEQAVLRRYRGHLAATFARPDAAFVIDDTTFPKPGRHSVGVPRPYCGALGKKANCQAAVSVHYVAPKGHYPLAMRLFPPEGWRADEPRLNRAGVPAEFRGDRTKGQIALELLDQVRAEGLAGRVVVADAGYGVSGVFRRGLAARGLHDVVGVTDEAVVFTHLPVWDEPTRGTTPAGGRPQTRPQLSPASPRPVRLRDLAGRTRRHRVTWPAGTESKLSARFAWVRVRPGHGWRPGDCAGADPVWLLIEERVDGRLQFALSNLPAGTSRLRAVRGWKSRWPVEQGYQQMKEELGPDYFEGRSWRGFHHHACLVMLAYGFLLLERHRAEEDRLNSTCAVHGAGARPDSKRSLTVAGRPAMAPSTWA